jgi:hypothetical protein
MRFLIFIVVIVLIQACSSSINETKHKQLIGFKNQFVMDMDELFEKPDTEYQKLTDEVNFYPETDTILYKSDTLYISYLTYVNSCAEYGGDIEIKGDSLFLKAKNVGEYECASGRIDRFIYTLQNPNNQKYTIVKF